MHVHDVLHIKVAEYGLLVTYHNSRNEFAPIHKTQNLELIQNLATHELARCHVTTGP